jgi:hypothetical protein
MIAPTRSGSSLWRRSQISRTVSAGCSANWDRQDTHEGRSLSPAATGSAARPAARATGRSSSAAGAAHRLQLDDVAQRRHQVHLAPRGGHQRAAALPAQGARGAAEQHSEHGAHTSRGDRATSPQRARPVCNRAAGSAVTHACAGMAACSAQQNPEDQCPSRSASVVWLASAYTTCC